MFKLLHLSPSLCLSCARVVLRDLRPVYLPDKRFCFITKIVTNNSSLFPCHQLRPSSFWSRQSAVSYFSYHYSHSDCRVHDISSVRLPVRCAHDNDRPSNLSPFHSLFLENRAVAGNTGALHEVTVGLLKASTPYMQSVRLYTSNTPGSDPPSKPSQSDSGKSPMSWKNLLIVAGLGCVIVLVVQYLKWEKEIERNKARSRLLGKAKLGGDWTLTDHHGNRRSSTEFRGQWLLIYFGFTHCPDVCPEEIEKIVAVINKTDADKNLPSIQPIVITVDPERDTPAALKEYCAEFSTRLLGFTGSPEEIEQATRAYRVYFSAGPKDDDSDYIVDHSIISYLINPRGEFVDFFGQNKTVSEIYNSIQLHIGSYLKKEKTEPRTPS